MSKVAYSMVSALVLFSLACGSSDGGGTDGGATSDVAAPTGDASLTTDAALYPDTPLAASDSATADTAVPSDGATADAVAPSGDGRPDGNPLMNGFVRGTVAGEVLDYHGFVASDQVVAPAAMMIRVGGSPGLDPTIKWSLAAPNMVGKYTCGAANPLINLGLSRKENNVQLLYGSTKPGTSCMIEITAAAPKVGDWAQGTFSGTLIDFSTDKTITVTDGAFDAYRYQ
jgi:hypothetical protein